MTKPDVRPTGTSTAAGLRENPRALGRLIDFALRLVAVIAVAWLVYDGVEGALAPLQRIMQPR